MSRPRGIPSYRRHKQIHDDDSSTRSHTEARQRPTVAASFLTIIVREMRAVLVENSVNYESRPAHTTDTITSPAGSDV